MNNDDSKDALQLAVSRLSLQSSPERDLWPGIEHAINEPPRVRWQRTAALAASLLLVLSTSLYFGRIEHEPDRSQDVTALIRALETEHAQSKQALLVDYQGQQAMYVNWEKQMDELEVAEQAIYQALRTDPDNTELLKILRQVQQKQLNLIDNVFSPGLRSI